MELSVMEICEFVKGELEKTFNEKFDIREDRILDKVLYILFDAFEIDYNWQNELLLNVLDNIKDMKIGKIKKDEAGNIIEKIDENTKYRIKCLCSLYCIISYNEICNLVEDAAINNKWEELKKVFNEKNEM